MNATELATDVVGGIAVKRVGECFAGDTNSVVTKGGVRGGDNLGIAVKLHICNEWWCTPVWIPVTQDPSTMLELHPDQRRSCSE